MSKLEEMRGVFARWKASGQSLRAFSRREKIPYSQLMYWQRKLRQEKSRAGASSVRSSGGANWVPVRVVDDAPKPSARAWFEVCLPGGVTLRIPPGGDEIELRRLLEALGGC